MWKCHKCEKPVYFAERRTSLGFEWHPECLRCAECSKRLNPGQHAEHKGVPYCHVPCYSALFGPTLFGHGSRVEAHTSFGRHKQQPHTDLPRSQVEAKLRQYNSHFEGRSGAILSRERNGRLILEGSLRIFWGVSTAIRLKEDDRRTEGSHPHQKEPRSPDEQHDNKVRRRPPVSRRLRRRCSINGHFYDRETSVFRVSGGVVSSVWVSSVVETPEVILLLLNKFKVINPPAHFALYVHWDNGERRRLAENECPLLTRVLLGPSEDVARVVIADAQLHDISPQVAGYLKFSDTELRTFLTKFEEEENIQIERIRNRYAERKCRIRALLQQLTEKEDDVSLL